MANDRAAADLIPHRTLQRQFQFHSLTPPQEVGQVRPLVAEIVVRIKQPYLTARCELRAAVEQHTAPTEVQKCQPVPQPPFILHPVGQTRCVVVLTAAHLDKPGGVRQLLVVQHVYVLPQAVFTG